MHLKYFPSDKYNVHMFYFLLFHININIIYISVRRVDFESFGHITVTAGIRWKGQRAALPEVKGRS